MHCGKPGPSGLPNPPTEPDFPIGRKFRNLLRTNVWELRGLAKDVQGRLPLKATWSHPWGPPGQEADVTDAGGDAGRVQQLEDELHEYAERMAEAERIARLRRVEVGDRHRNGALVGPAARDLRPAAGRVRGHGRRLHLAPAPRRPRARRRPRRPRGRDARAVRVRGADRPPGRQRAHAAVPGARDRRPRRDGGGARRRLPRRDRARGGRACARRQRAAHARDPRQLAVGRRRQGPRGPLPDDQRRVRAGARRPGRGADRPRVPRVPRRRPRRAGCAQRPARRGARASPCTRRWSSSATASRART